MANVPSLLATDVARIQEFAHDAQPADLLTYADLAELLGHDTRSVPRRRIWRTMARLNRHLLPTEQRYWHVVRNIGYRLLKAEEHLPVAHRRRLSATYQIQQGLAILAHVRKDELTPPQREAHAGMLLIMSGVYQAVKDTEQRVARQEGVLDELRQRMTRLETREIPSVPPPPPPPDR